MPDIREGQTATNPATGERVVYRGGAWVPVGSSGAGIPAGGSRGLDGSVMTAPGPRGGAPRRVGGLSTREGISIQEARDSAGAVQADLSDLEAFARLQQRQPTGGALAIPGARQLAGAFDPDVASMNAITARLAPAQRVPGSGTTSDRDLSLFLQASPSASQPRETNETLIDRGRQEAARRQLYAEFLDRYARQNGTLNGAAEAWRQNYSPPPVANNSPVPRGNVEPTAAQRATVERLNQSGGRNRRAVLGTQNNPRVPPEGFNVETLPAGDWYISSDGALRQVPTSRTSQGSRLRRQSGRARVVGVERVD